MLITEEIVLGKQKLRKPVRSKIEDAYIALLTQSAKAAGAKKVVANGKAVGTSKK